MERVFILIKPFASVAEEIVLDGGRHIEPFRILRVRSIFLAEDHTEAADEVIRIVLMDGGAVLRGIVIPFEEIVCQLCLWFGEPALTHGFLPAIFGAGAECPVIEFSAVAIGSSVIRTEIADFGDKVQVMAVIA